MKKIQNFFYKIADWTGVVSAVAYLGIVVLCIVDVFMDKAFTAPVQGGYELVERFMVIAVFTSFAYAQSRKAHINMTLITQHFPRVGRYTSLGVTSAIAVFSAGYLGMAAWTQWQTAMEMSQKTGILHIPLWPFYFVESVAMYFFAAVLAIDTIIVFLAIKNDEWEAEVAREYGFITRKDTTGVEKSA